jgi:large subunit ribosomal protein L13
MKYTVDAKGKSLGRLATEIAMILRGKNTPDFTPNVKPSNKVEVVNADSIELSKKKLDDDGYNRYSGYPGGLKHESRGHLLSRRGMGEIIRRTVKGMLPKNKLQKDMLKNLSIKK